MKESLINNVKKTNVLSCVLILNYKKGNRANV